VTAKKRIAAVRKALIGAAGFLGSLLTQGALHGNAQVIATSAVAALTAMGVYLVPNSPDTRAADNLD
jgi:hypothetical protein